MSETDGEQLALVPGSAVNSAGLSPSAPGASTRPRRAGSEPAAEHLATDQPVARVVIDTPLAHLDRLFEYAVTAADSDTALPGVRVRVRFAGRDHDGFIVSRHDESEHPGPLTPIRAVVSAESVLSPHLLRVCRGVADHYAGTLSDVLRLAIPPRHARAEKAVAEFLADEPSQAVGLARAGELAFDSDAWTAYPAGIALLSRLAAGESPHASMLALPSQPEGRDWPSAIAQAVAATRSSGRGSVVVVPDHRDLDRVSAALTTALGPEQHVTLSADLGPGARYSAWLSVLRGHHNVVVGTRAAAYAPIINPGLFAVWDDADDSHREPRSPYPHVRDIVRLRAHDASAGLLYAAHVRGAEVGAWIDSGEIRSVHATAAVVREAMPTIRVAGEGHEGARDAAASAARMPSMAWRAISQGLKRGPVLVQVPRSGYAVGLSCARCRHRIDCAQCHGPTEMVGPDAAPACQWCGRDVPAGPCPECGSQQWRTGVRGEQRTAYEIGRAFPGVTVHRSKVGQVLAQVPDDAAIVVSTPGAEPVARGGYAATILLDGWALLDRAGLDSPIEALRRWSAAAALTRSGSEGGEVVLAGVPPHGQVRVVEALVRWDPQWLVGLDLAERAELALPPFSRTVLIRGDQEPVAQAAVLLEDEGGLEAAGVHTYGPITDASGTTRLILRSPSLLSAAKGITGTPPSEEVLLRTTRWLRARRSATKAADRLLISVDSVLDQA